MPDITLDLPHHSYAVTVEPGALTRLAGIVRDAVPSADKVVLVTDEGVEPHQRCATCTRSCWRTSWSAGTRW